MYVVARLRENYGMRMTWPGSMREPFMRTNSETRSEISPVGTTVRAISHNVSPCVATTVRGATDSAEPGLVAKAPEEITTEATPNTKSAATVRRRRLKVATLVRGRQVREVRALGAANELLEKRSGSMVVAMGFPFRGGD